MEVLIKGAEYLQKWADQKNREVLKAMEDAVRITAFSIRKDMKDELKTGTLGLRAVIPYRNESRDPRYKRKRNLNPLSLLGIGIIYKFFKRDLRATIGFHGDTPGTIWTKKWAGEHQTGTTINYGRWGNPRNKEMSPMRKYLIQRGITIRKNTQTAIVPIRDIIQNFFNRHQVRAIELLKTNFRRKLRGERI